MSNIHNADKSIDALRGSNQRLRLEKRGFEDRIHELSDRIRYLEQQNQTITSILNSVGKLLDLKIIESENEIIAKKLRNDIDIKNRGESK